MVAAKVKGVIVYITKRKRRILVVCNLRLVYFTSILLNITG